MVHTSAGCGETAVPGDCLIVNAVPVRLHSRRLQSASKRTIIHNGVGLSGVVFHISLNSGNKSEFPGEIKRCHTVPDLHYIFPPERYKTADLYAHLLAAGRGIDQTSLQNSVTHAQHTAVITDRAFLYMELLPACVQPDLLCIGQI